MIINRFICSISAADITALIRIKFNNQEFEVDANEDAVEV